MRDNGEPSRRTVTLTINDKVEICLIDTGAQVSILPKVRYSATMEATSKLVMLNGSALTNYGNTIAKVRAEQNILREHKFTIAEVNRIILGIDFFDKCQTSFCLK